MKRRAWTKADDAKLTELIAAGWSQRCVGAAMNRSEYAISARAAVLGVRNPEAVKRNSAAAARAHWADKSVSSRTLHAIKASWTPERRARQAEIARRTTAKHPYRPPSPEGRERITASVKRWHRERFAWIPEDLRPLYHRLVRNRKKEAAVAEIKRLIAEREAQMTPFERQMAKVRAGAGIVEIRPLRKVEHTRSLTGCSLA